MKTHQQIQSEFSKKQICLAFLELLEKKDFEKITVSEISEKAGVSRLTFYRHFNTREEILTAYYETVFDEFFQLCAERPYTESKDLLLLGLYFWQENTGHVRLLKKQNMLPYLYEPFSRFMERILDLAGLSDSISSTQFNFILGGLQTALLEWVIEPSNVTSAEMADTLFVLINCCLEASANPQASKSL